MKLRERVAEARRQLPQGPAVKDYLFLEGPADLNGGRSRPPVPFISANNIYCWLGSLDLWIYHLHGR